MTPGDQAARELIKARQDAEDFLTFVYEQAGDQPLRFWETLVQLLKAERLPQQQAPVERLPVLNEQEATRFEATPMPYGKYAGETVGEVPCDYLLFLTEGDEFSQRLKRYVKSKLFQDRQSDE